MTRSFTDPVFNHTALSEARTAGLLPVLLDREESSGLDFLPTFMHEATHHWCFSSSVGTAIGLLQVRGLLRLLQAQGQRNAAARRSLELSMSEDLLRAQAILTLMGPLAEGLALYAEFDVRPSYRQPVLPPPLRWVVSFAHGLRDPGRRRPAAGMAWSRMAVGRLGLDQVLRKADLLVRPLDCDDGYLAGYLFVRNLHSIVRSREPRLTQPDAFLYLAQQHFYESEQLVDALLNPELRLPDALVAIGETFTDLVRTASSGTLPGLADRYEAAVSSSDSWFASTTAKRSGMDEVPARLTTAWEAAMHEEMAGPGGQSSLMRLLQGLAVSRDLMHIGSVPATITADGPDHAIAQTTTGSSAVRVRTASRDAAITPTGWIEVYLAVLGGYKVLALTNDNGQLVGADSGDDGDELPDGFRTMIDARTTEPFPT
ncbi:hypothetical protein [Plantactinospora sp. KBS50]|uniref:hypothetical protein n=1 Tax=Plantactinospora sp. KBS50 TaxID=2024580 RepID=UPI000BAAEAD5|nr:hypothetical protein [Plantactinospora sp. KBS50]ASW53440.1 hypothetical protein CIK06_03455 [Plantactinospora sp. KBS50]